MQRLAVDVVFPSFLSIGATPQALGSYRYLKQMITRLEPMEWTLTATHLMQF